METRVQKWGNSLAIRIPKVLAREAGLAEGTPVDFSIDEGAVIIRPKRYSLEELLAQVTPENLHPEINTGRPVGREAW